MEYGPGLYLTNFYETARKYVKGGGKVYKVTFKKANDIKNVILDTENVLDFIKSTRFMNKKELIDFINKKYSETIPAVVLLNLLVNFNSMTPATSPIVRQYLIDNNISYSVTHNYAGFNDQTIVVIFDPKIILSVKIVSPDLPTSEYHLNVNI